MALINQKTDLKSLKYGSEKPYVTKDIDNPPSGNGFVQQATKRIDDLSRIGQLIADKPGFKFAGNQALLLQNNTIDKVNKIKTQGTTSLGGAILQQVGQTVGSVGKIIGSTLAQVPVNGTGTHFVHGFRTDTYLQSSNQRSGFAQFFGAGGIEGAPLALRGETIIQDGSPEQGLDSFKTTDSKKLELQAKIQKQVNDKGFSTGDISNNKFFEKRNSANIPEIQDEYYLNRSDSQEVRNSLIKDGVEVIQNNIGQEGYNDSSEAANSELKQKQSIFDPEDSDRNQSTNQENASNTTEIDFRNPTRNKRYNEQGETTTYSFDYSSAEVNKQQRVNLGRQGKKIQIDPDKKYATTDPDTVDKLNRLDIQNSAASLEDSRDLISLNFQVITPETTRYLYFRAYLDNFSDNFNADWQGNKYLGRAESFYTYNGFDRNVSLGFKIAASTRQEMKPIYKKINYLASSTAPTYGEGTFMKGTIVKVTVGDYLYQVPAVVNSVQFSWETEYPWEISMSNPEGDIDNDMQVLPHVLDCSVDLSIIHNFIPQTGNNPFITNPFGNNRGKEVWISSPSN